MSDFDSVQTGLRWYRSLYWRIGLGLFAFLALMLAAQGALFLWITDRIAGSMPASSPQRLAELVSSDISAALTDDPTLDLHGIRQRAVRPRIPGVRGHHAGRADGHQRRERSAGSARQPARRRGTAFSVSASSIRATRVRPGARFPRRGDGPAGEGFPRRSRFPDGVPESAAGDRAIGNAPVVRRCRAATSRRSSWAMHWSAKWRSSQGARRCRASPASSVRRWVVVGGGRAGRWRGADRVRGIRSSASPAEAGAGRDGATRPGRPRGARTGTGGRRGGSRRQLIQSHGRGTGRTGGGAAGVGQDQASTPGGRVARAEYTADGDARLPRNPLDARTSPSTPRRDSGTSASSRRNRIDSSGSSGTSSISPGSKAEDGHAPGHRSTCRRSSSASPSGTSETWQDRNVRLVQSVAPGAETVAGDPDRLEQAMQNLAANALRHTPDGGSVTLSAERVDSSLRLRVSDTGPGIAPSTCRRSSTGSTRSTSRGSRRAAAASGCRSRRRSWNATAARSPPGTTTARSSKYASRSLSPDRAQDNSPPP